MAKFKPERRKCRNCGEFFTATRSWAKYCSPSCRIAYWRKTHPRLTPQEIAEIKQKLGIKIND